MTHPLSLVPDPMAEFAKRLNTKADEITGRHDERATILELVASCIPTPPPRVEEAKAEPKLCRCGKIDDHSGECATKSEREASARELAELKARAAKPAPDAVEGEYTAEVDSTNDRYALVKQGSETIERIGAGAGSLDVAKQWALRLNNARTEGIAEGEERADAELASLREVERKVASLQRRASYEALGYVSANIVVLKCNMCGERHRVYKSDYESGKYDIDTPLESDPPTTAAEKGGRYTIDFLHKNNPLQVLAELNRLADEAQANRDNWLVTVGQLKCHREADARMKPVVDAAVEWCECYKMSSLGAMGVSLCRSVDTYLSQSPPPPASETLKKVGEWEWETTLPSVGRTSYRLQKADAWMVLIEHCGTGVALYSEECLALGGPVLTALGTEAQRRNERKGGGK